MIYSGNNINIELNNNTNKNINKARLKGLGIVDIGNCEQLLKDNNLLEQNEYLFSLNTNFKNPKSVNNDKLISTQTLLTTLFDSKGNSVNTSICSDFTIKLPTANNIHKQSDYEFMKNLTGADIYNKSDPFFKDI